MSFFCVQLTPNSRLANHHQQRDNIKMKSGTNTSSNGKVLCVNFTTTNTTHIFRAMWKPTGNDKSQPNETKWKFSQLVRRHQRKRKQFATCEFVSLFRFNFSVFFFSFALLFSQFVHFSIDGVNLCIYSSITATASCHYCFSYFATVAFDAKNNRKNGKKCREKRTWRSNNGSGDLFLLVFLWLPLLFFELFSWHVNCHTGVCARNNES